MYPLLTLHRLIIAFDFRYIYFVHYKSQIAKSVRIWFLVFDTRVGLCLTIKFCRHSNQIKYDFLAQNFHRKPIKLFWESFFPSHSVQCFIRVAQQNANDKVTKVLSGCYSNDFLKVFWLGFWSFSDFFVFIRILRTLANVTHIRFPYSEHFGNILSFTFISKWWETKQNEIEAT